MWRCVCGLSRVSEKRCPSPSPREGRSVSVLRLCTSHVSAVPSVCVGGERGGNLHAGSHPSFPTPSEPPTVAATPPHLEPPQLMLLPPPGPQPLCPLRLCLRAAHLVETRPPPLVCLHSQLCSPTVCNYLSVLFFLETIMLRDIYQVYLKKR